MGNKNANNKESEDSRDHTTQDKRRINRSCVNAQTAGCSQLDNFNHTASNDFKRTSDNRIDDTSSIKFFTSNDNYRFDDIFNTTNNNTDISNLNDKHNNCKDKKLPNSLSSKSFSSSKTGAFFTSINYMKRVFSIRKHGKEDRGKDSLLPAPPPPISVHQHHHPHHHNADDVNGFTRGQLSAAKNNITFAIMVSNTTDNKNDKTKMYTASCTRKTSSQRRSPSRTQLIEGCGGHDDDCGGQLDGESSVFNRIDMSSNHGLPLRPEVISKSVLENSGGEDKGKKMKIEHSSVGDDVGKSVNNVHNHLKKNDTFEIITPTMIPSDLFQMDSSFSPMLNLELKTKSKIKIRTNPWIAQSTSASPLSSPLFVLPQITHTYPNTPVHENSLKANLSKKSDIQGQTLSVERGVLTRDQTLESHLVNSEEDMNSSSEGYYTSSVGSLSRCSLDSPVSDPTKSTKLVKESNNDSGYFATFSSETSRFSSAEENMIFGLRMEADRKTDEDGEWKVKHSLSDDTDMLLPCSKDLIAINKLLRMNYLEKELLLIAADAVNLTPRQLSPAGVQSDSKNIHQQADRLIFDFEKDIDDEVFESSSSKKADDLGQHSSLVRNHSFLVSRESSQSDGDTIISSTDMKKPRDLQEVCESVEDNFKCLNLQRNKMRAAVESIKWKEKIKKENLRMLREISVENKKEFLLSTLNRLKHCLDQQKSWLQQAYDEILQKKWPSLHHSRS